MLVWRKAATLLAEHGHCTLVTVVATRGSVPREVGARMIVAPDGSFHGTIGGGTLEWQALAVAQGEVAQGMAPVLRDYPLGPKLGQCCGGHVTLAFQRFQSWAACEAWAEREEAEGLALRFSTTGEVVTLPTMAPTGLTEGGGLTQHFVDTRTPLALFGAGHVGRALMLALAPLPFRVVWIDQRDDAFPRRAPSNVRSISVQNPADAVAPGLGLVPSQCFVVVMTHSHALDLAISDAALRRTDLGYVGLIGSATKRSRFMGRLRSGGLSEARLERLHCPIGLPDLHGKHPAVVAASVAADLLKRRERQQAAEHVDERLRRHG